MTGGSPLSVTILGGYLGAGKTTLVNHLLRTAEGLRLAVLVNEFGELPIDEDLIEARDDDIISISGGCVCCSYGNDLTRALMSLTTMTPQPDQVLLEASGVSIPAAIAATVGLLKNAVADGIIVLADAETIRQSAGDRYVGDTVLQQLQDADLVVLNKCDLVPDDDLKTTREWLAQLWPGVTVLNAEQGVVPPEAVLSGFLRQDRVGSETHSDTPGVVSLVLEPKGPVQAELLARELANPERGLVRAKGFVSGPDGKSSLIQVVGRRWSVSSVRGKRKDGIVCLGIEGLMDVPGIYMLRSAS